MFEHRDFGVQLGWGLVDLSATMVRSLGLGGLWGCGLQGFRCSGGVGFWDWVEGFSAVGVQRFGLWRFRGFQF